MRRVVASRPIGLRHELTLSCGHTVDAVHDDAHVVCLSCRPAEVTPNEAAKLQRIREAAKVLHEKARLAAVRRGRHDFPMLPYECSWAYEQEFLRMERAGFDMPLSRMWQNAVDNVIEKLQNV